jgi:uncharacterized protein with NRDE domain
MCLILFAYRYHPRYPLIVAANRDEFYDRPTAPASFWETEPRLLAGRDLRCGGTWLGVTGDGRFAALANYRDPRSMESDAPSRGDLVPEFLLGGMTPDGYQEVLREKSAGYNGFSLLFGTAGRLFCHCNRGDVPPLVQPGIHGLSNHLLDTPWPKVERGKARLKKILKDDHEPSVEELFSLLADRSQPDDRHLPDTGVGLEKERLLAPLFISGMGYGTRSSTVLLIDRDGTITFTERTWHGAPQHGATAAFRFRIEN